VAVPTPYSYRSYNGDGTTVTFAVPFPYILREHVKVYEGWTIDDRLPDRVLVPVVDYEWITDTSITLKVPPATVNPLDPAVPPGPVVLSVVRETPIAEQLSKWQTGSPPTALELNTADLQVLYAVQEYLDQVNAVSVVVVDSNEELKKLFSDLTAVVGQNSQATAAATAAAAGALAQAYTAEQEALKAQQDAAAVTGIATSAQTAADQALAKANQAQTTADGIASTANLAQATANEAKASALVAQQVAGSVAGTAATAQTTADAAKATADAAKTTADGVAGTANTALTTANAADVKATQAKTAADGVAGTAAAAQAAATQALSAASAADIKGDQAKADAAAAKATADAAVKRAGDKMTGDLTVPSLNGGQLAGLRNRIINGAFQVDQRKEGAAQAIAANSESWCCDRWLAGSYGSAGSAQRVLLGTASPVPCIFRLTGGAGNTSVVAVQRIESWNSDDLAGTKVSLSLNTRSTVGRTLTWQLRYATNRDTWGAFNAEASTTIATGTWTISDTTQRYEAQIDIPAAAVNGLEVVFALANVTSGNWEISNVQLEKGPVATPFEYLPIGLDIQLCRRYFQWVPMTYLGSTSFAGAGVVLWEEFPVEMRTTPTVGATVTDPLIESSAGNVGYAQPSRMTRHGLGVAMTPVVTGGFYVIGYRNSADAEIP
jgi:hypothetical protein